MLQSQVITVTLKSLSSLISYCTVLALGVIDFEVATALSLFLHLPPVQPQALLSLRRRLGR
jgi:hypothetical protein